MRSCDDSTAGWVWAVVVLLSVLVLIYLGSRVAYQPISPMPQPPTARALYDLGPSERVRTVYPVWSMWNRYPPPEEVHFTCWLQLGGDPEPISWTEQEFTVPWGAQGFVVSWDVTDLPSGHWVEPVCQVSGGTLLTHGGHLGHFYLEPDEE